MTDRPPVTIVVLGWNLKEETAACVESALKQDYAPCRVLIVDNGSTDGAPEYLRARFPAVEMLLLERNLGIAEGYNRGMARAFAEGANLVFVVNNDTILAPDLITRLVEASDRWPTAGVFMPKVYVHGTTTLWSAGARRRFFPPGIVFIGLGAPDGPAFAAEREISYAPSCGLLIRREVIERIGGFDASYFMYYDDWDFCERVRRGGFSLVYVPTAHLWHKVSLSTANSGRPARWWYIMGRSAVRYYRSYYRPSSLYLGLYAGWFVLREVVKGNGRFVGLFLDGIRDAVRGRAMRTAFD